MTKSHELNANSIILTRRILRPLRATISTRVDTCVHIDLDCVKRHLKCVLEGMPFFTKNKKGKKSGFLESFSKFIPINLQIHWNELQNSFQPIS